MSRYARWFAVVLIAALPVAARAHQDPDDCFITTALITISIFRSDGATGVVGPVTDCEQILYRTTLANGGTEAACALSGGTLALTTPDGVVHILSADVPCIGGEDDGCDPSLDAFVSEFVPYTASATNVDDGTMTVTAVYGGGVTHDNPIRDTPGVWVSTARTTSVVPCGIATTVPTSSSTTTTLTANDSDGDGVADESDNCPL